MREENKRIFTLCYGFLLLLILLAVASVIAQEVEVRVNAPEYVEVTFDVTIDISEVTNFDSAQFNLSFDSSVVNVTDVTDGCLDGEAIPILTWNLIDVDTIQVIVDNQGIEGVNGSGYLVNILFEVKGEGGAECVLDIHDGLLVNNTGAEIPAKWIDAEIRIGKEEEPTPTPIPIPTLIPTPVLTPSPTPRPLTDQLAILLEPGEYKLELSVQPGDSDSKELFLANDRDFHAYNISYTPVVGNATDMISINESIKEISPGYGAKVTIIVSVPEDQEFGNYTGYSYFFFSSTGSPPPMPFKLDFLVSVVPEAAKEIYNIDLKIDGRDDVAFMNIKSNETASYKLTVKNTGMYFDMLQIEAPEFEADEGWTVKLYDNNKEVTAFPCYVQLNEGKEHDLILNVSGTMPGTNLAVEITGRSCANNMKMDSVRIITYIITGEIEEAVNDTNATKDGP
jgi:hypothetical protein